LEFQLGELQKAGLKQGEEAALKEERDILANAQNISQALRHCYDLLYAAEDGLPAISALKYCVDDMASVEAFSTEYANIAEQLREHYYSLEETAHELSSLADAVSFDGRRQEEIEERLEYISALKRKYGAANVGELIEMQEGFQADMERLRNAEALSHELSSRINGVKNALYSLYTELSAIRRKTAAALSDDVERELKSLGMENARFEARFAGLPSRSETVFAKDGIDTVEFYISTNAGEPPRPLAKTASGGEISRIMLAFKNVTAKTDKISTMVFDEIDTGISGMTAHVVAEKMAAIAKHRQIICVTHLPQIAAMADRNFFISKSSAKNATNTNIKVLADHEVAGEIARLSGGAGSQNAAAYARELIEKAHDAKERISCHESILKKH
jgi:DNA repair protein RecN (Recombination protein N)